MAIKTQGSKIIRNLAGEILKEPLIVDLDYRYGVSIYENSTDVKSWISNNSAKKAMQLDQASSPTVIGDGLYFNALSFLNGLYFDYSQTYTLEMWVRPDSIGSMVMYSIRNDNLSYFQLYTSSSNTIAVALRNVTYPTLLPIPKIGDPLEMAIDEWHHVLITYNRDSLFYTISIDGYPQEYALLSKFIPTAQNPRIGSRNSSGDRWDGSIAVFKVSKYFTESCNNVIDSNTPKVNRNEKLFTPPTFPNTIL